MTGTKKTYLRAVPPSPPSTLQRVRKTLAGWVLSPAFWALAHRDRVPGLRLHGQSARLALRLLRRPGALPYAAIHRLAFFPLDSTRYFELDFMMASLRDVPLGRFLDVSSPRLFPVLLLATKTGSTADLINPDEKDLAVTARVVEGLGFSPRCRFHTCPIESAPFEREWFDAVTSISVVEHIPDDRRAVETMWRLVRPGGRLLLTVPCSAEASEQYIDANHYGLPPDAGGFVLFQHIYDDARLRSQVFSVTGAPTRVALYGETQPGFLEANLARKRTDHLYPYWREPYMMGRHFRRFGSLAELPGEGVIGMEFVKA